MTTFHLGFDMGIRNLAYCLIRHEVDKKWTILAWDNIDLLEGGVSSQDAKKCVACGGLAKWIQTSDTTKWCQACATQKRVKKRATLKPAFPTIPCALAVVPLRALALSAGVEDVKKQKKEALITWAAQRYLMPWKPVKATDSPLCTIRAAMDKWLDSTLPTLAQATLIRLENQPVMKGPTMKSVQIILFTLLAHRLEREHGWKGSIEFVHAGVKTRGATADTDATATTTATAATAAVTDTNDVEKAKTAADGKAYRARKNAAEDSAMEELTKAGAITWLDFFKGRSKKSDLADAFLMALRA
jgi:hypothetical protein